MHEANFKFNPLKTFSHSFCYVKHKYDWFPLLIWKYFQILRLSLFVFELMQHIVELKTVGDVICVFLYLNPCKSNSG